MGLVYGVLCWCSAALLFVIALLGARDPRRPWWASDFLVANVHAVGILTLGFYGTVRVVLYMFQMPREPIGGGEFALIAGAVAVTLVSIKALRVRRRLGAYRTQATAGTVIAFAGDPAVDGGPNPPPPAKPRKRRLAA